MKKNLLTALALLTALTLCACGILPPAQEALTETLEAQTETAPETFSETLPETAQTETEEPIVQTAEEERLFLPDVSPELMTEYFEEVVLRTEYSTGDGNPSLVQKWEMPIHYRIYGEPSEQDLAILENLFERLNAIHGFPGIGPAAEERVENLSIYFAQPKEFDEIFSDFLNGRTFCSLSLMLQGFELHLIGFSFLTWQNIRSLNIGVYHHNRSLVVCIIPYNHRHF